MQKTLIFYTQLFKSQNEFQSSTNENTQSELNRIEIDIKAPAVRQVATIRSSHLNRTIRKYIPILESRCSRSVCVVSSRASSVAAILVHVPPALVGGRGRLRDWSANAYRRTDTHSNTPTLHTQLTENEAMNERKRKRWSEAGSTRCIMQRITHDRYIRRTDAANVPIDEYLPSRWCVICHIKNMTIFSKHSAKVITNVDCLSF